MSLLGFRGIDVGAFAGWAHFEPRDLAQNPQTMAEQILRAVQPYEMKLTDLIVTFGSGLIDHCVNFPDRAVRDKNLETFKQLTTFCKLAGIPGISLCPGAIHSSIGQAASLELAITELARLAQAGHDAGLRVSFEPHVESIAESPQNALLIVQQAPNLTLTLDYSHFIYQGYSDSEIDELIPFTGHFHVRQAKAGSLQCRTCEGTIDFDQILSKLRAIDYAGWVAFEYVWEEWMNNDRVDVLSETLVLRRQLSNYFSE